MPIYYYLLKNNDFFGYKPYWESIGSHWESIGSHWESLGVNWEQFGSHWESFFIVFLFYRLNPL